MMMMIKNLPVKFKAANYCSHNFLWWFSCIWSSFTVTQVCCWSAQEMFYCPIYVRIS